jgi:outer membrane murein-binding lipoprotein Lpp
VGEDPDRIRQEIVDTRERMGEKVDALSYKADVPARTKDRISNTKDAAMEKLTGTKDTLVSKVSGSTPDTGQVRDQMSGGARQAVGLAQSNPLGLAVGAAAVGFLAGMLLPGTRMENERIGEISDEVKGRAADVGREALEHGKEVAQETAQAAMETAKQAGQEHAGELRDTATEQAQETRETVSP